MRTARTGVLVIIVLATTLLTAVPIGAVSSPKGRLLSSADLPAGWSATNQPRISAPLPCLAALDKPVKKETKALVTFKDGTGTTLSELIATGPGQVAKLQLLDRTLRTCHGGTVLVRGEKVHYAVGRLALPKITRTSASISLTATVTVHKFWYDTVTFRVSSYIAILEYEGQASLDETMFLALAREAAAKADGMPVNEATSMGTVYTPEAVSETVLHEITDVPTSAYNSVGTGFPSTVTAPTVHSGQKPLTIDGRPGVFLLAGEFCPYCAAERWAVIASLSRFGTFSGLMTMQSSPIDIYPKTQTFEFNTATYTSPYIAADLVEYYGQDQATGSQPVINELTKTETSLVERYDTSETMMSGSIPFLDIGNKVVFVGASYTPSALREMSRTTIAYWLKDPHTTITQRILGTSNFMSAGICSIDGGKPGSVCSSAGVEAAAKVLKISA